MDAKIKALWVDMLRNSTLPQTRNQLKSDEGYCCLGVLGHCLLEHGLVPANQQIKETKYKLTWVVNNNRKNDVSIPEDQDENGHPILDSEGNALRVCGLTSGETSALIRMNDEQRLTFVEIATWIEENL